MDIRPGAMIADPQAFCCALLGQAALAVSARDPDGIYLAVNPEFERLFALPAGGVVGCGDAAFFAADAVAAMRAADDRVLASGESHCGEETVVCAGGVRHLLTVRYPLRDAQGTIVAIGAMSTDISDRKRLVDELSHARELAERANDELRVALAEMEHLASIDRLTGSWNRRRFEDAAVVEMSRAERYGHPVAILLLDVDHFKNINDFHGHAVGDRVLVEFARRIGQPIRKADSVARWGGEEFVVLAPNTRLAEAWRLAEKLREHVAGQPFGPVGAVTVSIGVAEYQRGEGLDGWMLRADQALYAAKAGGRNRVVADPLTSLREQPAPYKTSSVMQLVWREAYASGHPLIDAQHQRLFDLANRLLDRISAGSTREEIALDIGALVNEISTHFADEEEIQRDAGFPGATSHADEHAQLLTKAGRLRRYVNKGTMAPVDLFHFLAYEVIAQHFLGSDREFFGHLNRIGVPTIRQ